MTAEPSWGEGSPTTAAGIVTSGTDVPVWPKAQTTNIMVGSQIALTHFADFAVYHSQLIEATLAAAHDPRFHDPKHLVIPAGCGAKARNIQDWRVPAATLVHARALTLAYFSLAKNTVFADDTWASIYRNGDYCMAHGHTRADVSVIYMLDPGDADPADPLSGRLCFVDPRIDWCCPIERGRVTRPLIPPTTPGTMLVFPGSYLHCVTPYRGVRPRITLSWNITRERLGGGPRDWAG